MKRWPIKPLGEVSGSVMGQAPPGNECNVEGKGTPFVKAGEFGEQRPVIREWTTKPLKFAKSSDVLVCVVGATCGKLNLGADCAIGRSVAAIRSNPSVLNQGFLYAFLQGQTLRLRSGSQGSAQGVITREMIGSIPIPVPPLAEQERIVKLLDEADELRKLRAQADRRSAALIPALFHEMFGDPIANPKAWPVHKLPEACAGKEGIKAGPFGSSLKKDCYTTEGPRVYGQEQVIAGDFTIGDYRISEEKFNEMAAYAIAADDVLISLVGTIGKVAIVPDAIERGIINPRLLRVRPRREMMHPVYLSHVLTAPSVVAFFGSVATGITMGVLNAGMLKRLSIPVPPLPLQQEFAQRVSEIRALQAAQAASRQRTEHLFQSMLHRAFNQEL